MQDFVQFPFVISFVILLPLPLLDLFLQGKENFPNKGIKRAQWSLWGERLWAWLTANCSHCDNRYVWVIPILRDMGWDFAHLPSLKIFSIHCRLCLPADLVLSKPYPLIKANLPQDPSTAWQLACPVQIALPSLCHQMSLLCCWKAEGPSFNLCNLHSKDQAIGDMKGCNLRLWRAADSLSRQWTHYLIQFKAVPCVLYSSWSWVFRPDMRRTKRHLSLPLFRAKWLQCCLFYHLKSFLPILS